MAPAEAKRFENQGFPGPAHGPAKVSRVSRSRFWGRYMLSNRQEYPCQTVGFFPRRQSLLSAPVIRCDR